MTLALADVHPESQLHNVQHRVFSFLYLLVAVGTLYWTWLQGVSVWCGSHLIVFLSTYPLCITDCMLPPCLEHQAKVESACPSAGGEDREVWGGLEDGSGAWDCTLVGF